MGSAPSSQRGGKAIQSETALKESTNAMDTAQVADMTKGHIITTNPEDPKNGNVAPSKNTAALASSTTCADATEFSTKLPEHAIGTHSSQLGGVQSAAPPILPEAVFSSHTLATPEVVTPPYDHDEPNRGPAHRKILSTVTKQADTRNSNVGKRPRKRSRRGKGRGNDKDAGRPDPEDTENVPPTTREDKSSHQRRAHRPGRARTGARQTVTRGRSENRAGRTDTIDSEGIAVTRLAADGVSGGNESTSRSAKPCRTRGTTRRSSAGFRSKASGHSPSRARAGANVPASLPVHDVVSAIEEDAESPEVAKTNHMKTYDETHRTDKKNQAVPVSIAASTTGTPVTLNKKAAPMVEADMSIVPPLPSSTRRRAKEYFQRRTRERSVDAETGPPRGAATVAEQGRRTNGGEPNQRLQIESGAKKRPARWSVPVSDKNYDQFAFDPEASPFTPNATSSPRQGSPSSIGVQSFSSPTPLPPHGNRNVAPLTLVGNSSSPETLGSSSQLPIPLTPLGTQTQGGQQDNTYTYYAGRDHAQAHLQAEHLALIRLQAYYSWLAGKATEHMDLSGGSGGLSGGVALGRQGGGRGKAQTRNSSGAYAHPKEHVVYSPREHERAQLASGTISEQGGTLGRPGTMKPKEGEPDNMPEAVAQRAIQKWDGNWGLREATGREVGWGWGANGAGVVGSAGT